MGNKAKATRFQDAKASLDVPRCPKCGATELEAVLSVAPTLYFCGEEYPSVSDFMRRSGEDEFSCLECGYEWLE
jgi:hypothetical protein